MAGKLDTMFILVYQPLHVKIGIQQNYTQIGGVGCCWGLPATCYGGGRKTGIVIMLQYDFWHEPGSDIITSALL